ncbi:MULTISPECIES: DNA mismatch repair endonuclease MutL [Pseudomonadati]|uniref:DNA mismatch repair protein MutL n=1 Tax=Shewanella aestuarii TaxID=1028752 RepID=A0ABT0KZJ8_9GAMM|nr:DNA mismatch repair endonuclease MutL [Shewanella aestuarii]MCL1116665.1 DNA mismatch repair endonuclease MutL [Shewanella aestuarii]GGN72640.1 DNA mismatch repair protein MutL [Shewanella aestuarii]
MAIQLLPPQLANQIAAGEVVERPASVVKELVENSLDAGATRVDIEIDKGGSKLIRIRDNGAGIPKDELALALSRHATSKVHSLDDLEAIMSFGFRGEALASISSVARLTLTSKTVEQTEAWQAFAEGSQMDVKITPAAHPQGSTIDVVDLFFNTPARRRFLKSDKTEFTHIDEWLKRIAIARCDIHFTLTHNGKLVRQYRPANTDIQHQQRLGQICGRQFAENALTVSCEHDGLSLRGYLQSPFDNVISESSYFYVNGRLVRDRLVNHAVRQAFAEHGVEHQPGYVLMLDLDPHQVDVNVHPAKHEVRFHQSRYVHDFILQALQSALSQMVELVSQQSRANVSNENKSSQQSDYSHSQSKTDDFALADSAQGLSRQEYASSNDSRRPNSVSQFGSMHVPGQASHSFGGYSSDIKPRYDSSVDKHEQLNRAFTQSPNTSVTQAAINSYGQLLQNPEHAKSAPDDTHQTHVLTQDIANLAEMPNVLDGQFWVLVDENELKLMPILAVQQAVLRHEILHKLATGLIGQPLLMPVSVKADPDWQLTLDQNEPFWRQLGIELTIRYGQLIIKKVPPYLRDSQLAAVIPELLQWMNATKPNNEALALWIAQQSTKQFMTAQTIWQKFCLLQDEAKQIILANAQVLPWQAWIKENA